MIKLKILLVDDEPMFIEMLKARLESLDCVVITASNGKEALEKIENNKLDAVLLDILMPMLDGISTLEIIRKRDKNLPVFMMTSFSTEDRIDKAKMLGATGYLVKESDLKTEIENIVVQLRGKSQ